MRIVTEPEIYIVGRQTLNNDEVQRFLNDHETYWETDSEYSSELIVELAGRVCYMSWGDKQFRKTNSDYIGNLINQEHGSVLEHAVWDLLLTGVSRSLTHELVRHRAGTGVSQLSQRYVDESTADFFASYHRRLSRGDDPTEALRRTQLEWVAQDKGGWQGFSTWAAFALFGATTKDVPDRERMANGIPRSSLL